MRVKRGQFALGSAAIAVAGFMLSPATGAAGRFTSIHNEASPVSLNALGSISSFTPTTKDKRLAAAYAKIAQGASKSFRFTPTSGSMSGQRSVTVMVRAAGNDDGAVNRPLTPVNIVPMAFSLNTQRGWRKFALPESIGRKELDPVAVETLAGAKNFSLEQGKKDRFSTKVLVEGHRDTATPRAAAGEKDYSLDLASSYSLTRNLNVTAGVRYNNNVAGRLTPMTDERQDAQAVYLGTIFKF